jgi:hypothetical protein
MSPFDTEKLAALEWPDAREQEVIEIELSPCDEICDGALLEWDGLAWIRVRE